MICFSYKIACPHKKTLIFYMSHDILRINQNLDAFYTQKHPLELLSLPPTSCYISPCPNKAFCSFIYKVLLDRYPDLPSNTSVPTFHEYPSYKILEIHRSQEYSSIPHKFAASLDIHKKISITRHGTPILLSQIPPPNSHQHNQLHILHLSLFFLETLKCVPTKLAYAYQRFFVLDATPLSLETLTDIYSILKAEYWSFSLSDFNRVHLPDHVLCPYQHHITATNLLASRIPDFSELEKRITVSSDTLQNSFDFIIDTPQMSAIYILDFASLFAKQCLHLNSGGPLCDVYSFKLVPAKSLPRDPEYLLPYNVNCVFVKDRVALVPLFIDHISLLNPDEFSLSCTILSSNISFSDSNETTPYNYTAAIRAISVHTHLMLTIMALHNNPQSIYPPNSVSLLNSCYLSVLGRPCDTPTLLRRLSASPVLNISATVLDLFKSTEYIQNLLQSLKTPHTHDCAAVPRARPRIKYYGHAGTSGYAICCKLIVWALFHHGFDIQFNVIDNYQPSSSPNDYDRILHILARNVVPTYDILVIHSIPSNWDRIRTFETSRFPHAKIYGITVWETERLPRDWVPPMSRVHMISCPCDYNKKAFEIDIPRSVPVVTVHHPITILETETDPAHLHTIFRLHNITPSTYKFYTINELNGRKALTQLIRIFCETFGPEDDVFLYIKTSQHHTRLQLTQFLDRLQTSLAKKLPSLYIDQCVFSEKQIAAIHTLNDCYISISKGEGTGYSSCQAVLFDKPIIIPNYSATPEYIKHAEFVDVDIVPASYCDHNFTKHRRCHPTRCIFNPFYDSSYQVWGQPRVHQVREKMLHCFRHKLKHGDPRSRQHILTHFNFEKVAQRFAETFDTLLVEQDTLNSFPLCSPIECLLNETQKK